MRKQRKLATVVLLSLASGLLGACAQWDIETAEVPANVKAFALTIPQVENSKKSPCWQQRQIAKQQAFIQSIATGTEIVRNIACGGSVKKKPVAKAAL